PLISYIPGIHAEYTANLDLLMFMKMLLDEYKMPFFTHNSETKREVEECIERHGLTPTQLFEENGLFEHGGGGFHCVHMTEHDLDIFRARGLWVITNPGSNAKLASGIAPLRQMRELGIRMAIGTDGPSSNNALDFFREMYLAAVLQKLHCGDAAALPADDVLHMATVGGAQAMGLSDCDVLAPGKQADLIVIDLQRPNMQPVHNAARNLVYSGSKENVRLTMIAGRVLYENGAFFVGEPLQDIYRAVETNFAAMRAAL
ncbi:MAG: amidohydrolase, partial [Clostridiales bacterium]|nr:amidohydrolase [Clostridiales bacterium]